MVGLENQTKIDPKICFRLYGYDGAAYKSQYKAKKNYPVITLVLYFGDKRWNGAKSLRECLDVPKELESFFNDYKMNLIEVAWQTDEQIAMYKSDFKIIADYFVQKRKNRGEYSPSKVKFRHVDSILKTMSALTGDDRFEQIINERQKGEGKVDNMCKVLDKVENRGIRKGRKEGRQEGRQEGSNELNALYSYLYDQGRDADVKKACKDVKFRNELLEMYRNKKPILVCD